MASRDKSSPAAASREDSGAEWDALLPGATEDVDEDEDLGSVEASPFDAAIDRIGFGRAQVRPTPRIDPSACANIVLLLLFIKPCQIRTHGQIQSSPAHCIHVFRS